jgi:hypothetical protein
LRGGIRARQVSLTDGLGKIALSVLFRSVNGLVLINTPGRAVVTHEDPNKPNASASGNDLSSHQPSVQSTAKGLFAHKREEIFGCDRRARFVLLWTAASQKAPLAFSSQRDSPTRVYPERTKRLQPDLVAAGEAVAIRAMNSGARPAHWLESLG